MRLLNRALSTTGLISLLNSIIYLHHPLRQQLLLYLNTLGNSAKAVLIPPPLRCEAEINRTARAGFRFSRTTCGNKKSLHSTGTGAPTSSFLIAKYFLFLWTQLCGPANMYSVYLIRNHQNFMYTITIVFYQLVLFNLWQKRKSQNKQKKLYISYTINKKNETSKLFI